MRLLVILIAISIVACAPAGPPASPLPTVAPVPTDAPGTPPPYTAAPEPAVRSAPTNPAVLENPDLIQLLVALRSRGISVGDPQESRAAFLYPVQGVVYKLDSGQLYIHPFASSQAAEQRAKEIPAQLTPSVIDWVAPPHFYRCQSLLVLYLGTDAQVLQALNDLCGNPFVRP